MIRLITPKRDLYMEGDTYNPQGLFGKQGVFYEVGYEGEDIMFLDERGVEHSYGLDFVDEDFWTVDFDKGFDFLSGIGQPYILRQNILFTEYDPDCKTDYSGERENIAVNVIQSGGWKITRFSNQEETTNTETTPVKNRPFENWKKDIGLGKFIRSTAKSNVVMCVIGDINGYLDIKNNLFYYHKFHKGQHTYLCCKVECNLEKGWHFIRENKDSSLIKEYTPEAKGMQEKVEDSDVLASFSVPEDSSERGGEVSEEVSDEYTGGSVNYYKLTLKDLEVECNDIIEALDMNYAEGNAFKAIWRKCAAAKFGIKKKGYDNGLYDSEKVVFFGERMVIQSKAKQKD